MTAITLMLTQASAYSLYTVMVKKRRDPGLTAVCEAGKKTHKSLSALARAIGVRPQSLCKWERVPPERVIQLEEATGVPREVQRPDLYPVRQGL